MAMTISFTGIVYLPLTFALLFIAYRFYKDWQKEKNADTFVYYFTFILLSLICSTGAIAGSVFAHNAEGIRWMLIVSSLLITMLNAGLGYLFVYHKIPKISPWFGFAIIFIIGIFTTAMTYKSKISPILEPSGGIYWGLPFYLSALRFVIYFLGMAPLSVLLYQRFKAAKNRDTKTRNLVLLVMFIFILLIVTVDFILEPLMGAKALLSEQAILFLLMLYMFLYFYFMERFISKSDKRFRRLVENMIDMVCLIDSDGIIHYANNSHHAVLGYESGELIGKSIFDIVHNEDRNTLKYNITNAADNTSPAGRFEFRFINSFRRSTWVETFGSFLLDTNSDENKSKEIVLASRDITERKKAEQKLIKSLNEKETLLAEIHHRVKNNLATVIGLLNMQLPQISHEKAKAALVDTRDRIYSMSLVHHHLYESEDYSNIDFKEYVVQMVNNLKKVLTKSCKIDLQYDLDEFTLDIEKAIPCGLLINELVTNAFKHAFPNTAKGNLQIIMHLLNRKHIELIIKDNGIGIPKDIDLESTDTLGLKLVDILADQLGGELVIKSDKGTEFKFTFEKN